MEKIVKIYLSHEKEQATKDREQFKQDYLNKYWKEISQNYITLNCQKDFTEYYISDPMKCEFWDNIIFHQKVIE